MTEVSLSDISQGPLWILAEFASELNTVLDFPNLQQVLGRNLRWALDFDRCTIAYHLDPTKDHYELFEISPAVKTVRRTPQRVPLWHGWPGRVLDEEKPYFLSDLQLLDHNLDPPQADIGLCLAARSLMLLPLRCGQRTVGCLCFSSRVPDSYNARIRNIGTVLAAQIAGQIGTILTYQQVQEALQELQQSQVQLQDMAVQLAYQANHDALTGLVNRREFERLLGECIRETHVRDERHVLCYLDLDHFKIVNDTCGHAAGDALLQRVAAIVRSCVEASDVLARMGGDEFAVLFPYRTIEAVRPTIDAVRNAIRGMRFHWGGQVFALSGSIGVEQISVATLTAEDAMHAADAACYAAKHHGRDQIAVYTPDNAAVIAARGEAIRAHNIATALEENRFHLYFQPILPLKPVATGERYELLLRMVDSNGDSVPPSAFIPAAERYDLMAAIDRWVIAHAFDLYTNIYGRTPERHLHTCAINLSSTSLSDGSLLTYIQSQFAQSGMPPATVCFEIAETAVVSNLSTAATFMHALREQGCRFALDDFGHGLTSFTYLKNLPVDYIKIADVFTPDHAHDQLKRIMLGAINDIGHVMGIETNADHIEHDEMLTVLRELGVDYAQGFTFAPPRSISQL